MWTRPEPLPCLTAAEPMPCAAMPIPENTQRRNAASLQGPAANTAPDLPLTCGFQSKQAGSAVTFCTLPHNTCPFQRLLPGASAEVPAICSDPHCVPTDWQVVTCASEGLR
jgi:hypothetical protein